MSPSFHGLSCEKDPVLGDGETGACGFTMPSRHGPVALKAMPAFVTTKEDPEINQPTIDYVATYVPDQTGEKFNPHVTIGLATQDYLKKMVDEKFEPFTFSPAGAAVYHLGNFGTARKELKSWKLKP